MEEEIDLFAAIEQMSREEIAALLDVPPPSPEEVEFMRKLIAERLGDA